MVQQDKLAQVKTASAALGLTQEETHSEVAKSVRVCCIKTILLDVNTENAWKQRQYTFQAPVVASAENMDFVASVAK
jgi:hypothetical protein